MELRTTRELRRNERLTKAMVTRSPPHDGRCDFLALVHHLQLLLHRVQLVLCRIQGAEAVVHAALPPLLPWEGGRPAPGKAGPRPDSKFFRPVNKNGRFADGELAVHTGGGAGLNRPLPVEGHPPPQGDAVGTVALQVIPPFFREIPHQLIQRLQQAHGQMALLAEEQSGGRGTHGRSFHSPRGDGLYLSVLIRPRVELADLLTLTGWVAVAAREGVDISSPER